MSDIFFSPEWGTGQCRIAVSTVTDGNLSYRWGEAGQVLANRQVFLTKNNVHFDRCVSMRTRDASEIQVVDSSFAGRGMAEIESAVEVDALITQEPDLPLFLLTADCIPAIVLDAERGVLALAHLSSKCTGGKLVQKVVQAMQERFSCRPENLEVALGPGIHKESFRFNDPIQKRLPGWEPFIKDLENSETAVDLYGYNRFQLEEMGVRPEKIWESPVDTAQDARLFSHYRAVRNGEVEGRFATVVELVKRG